MTKKYDDLNVIKQIVGLQNLNNADLDKMWRKFFDDRPEIESRQYMIAKIALSDSGACVWRCRY